MGFELPNVTLSAILLWFSMNTLLPAQIVSTSRQPSSTEETGLRDAGNMASTYVPLESWVYPALDRLAAFGYVQTAFAGQRPWSRMECARLIAEAGELQALRGANDVAGTIYVNLSNEFAKELQRQGGAANIGAQMESVYLRTDGISGPILNDGYHFAQIQVNDYGRPYGRGFNAYVGASARAEGGPFAIYIRAEFQRAGSGMQVSSTAQSAIAQADFLTVAPAGPMSSLARGRLLDAYATYTFKNNQFSFGKQSLWWGPGKGGPLLFSNNAEPLTMLRYDRVVPFKLPSFGGWLGPIRGQFVLGRMSGQQFVHVPGQTIGAAGVSLADQPFIHGEKVSFKPTANFEFSVSRTAIFGGPKFPATITSFWHSLTSYSNSGDFSDPGDRRSGFDAQYRVPGIRNWLTVYVDTFTDDEPFPLAYPTQSAWSPGVYLPKLPRLPKLDFRAEGFITPPRDLFPGFYYFNVHYLSGYTNNRQLMGSWIGREGHGFQLWNTVWLSPRSYVQTSYRSMSVDHGFLLGGNLRALSATTEVKLKSEWSVRVSAQYERWQFPLLVAGANNNFAASVQLTYLPGSGRH